jgi:hypothetical protein
LNVGLFRKAGDHNAFVERTYDHQRLLPLRKIPVHGGLRTTARPIGRPPNANQQHKEVVREMSLVHKGYGIFMGVYGVLMIGWGVAYGIENYKGDECRETVRVRIDAMNAQTNEINAQTNEIKKSIEQRK